jgi:hypothetical protein
MPVRAVRWVPTPAMSTPSASRPREQEGAELVGADQGHEARVDAEAGQTDGDVRRRTAQMAGEALGVAQRDAALLGEEVDDDLAEAENVEVRHARHAASS